MKGPVGPFGSRMSLIRLEIARVNIICAAARCPGHSTLSEGLKDVVLAGTIVVHVKQCPASTFYFRLKGTTSILQIASSPVMGLMIVPCSIWQQVLDEIVLCMQRTQKATLQKRSTF